MRYGICSDGLYFEKPGQDFYEPYRIEYFKRWQIEWPNTRLKIYRKNSGSTDS